MKVEAPIIETSTESKKSSEPKAPEIKPEVAVDPSDPVKTSSVDEKVAVEKLEEESPPQDPPAESSAQNIFGSIGSASTFSFGSTKPATTATASSTSFVFGNTTSSATSLFGNAATTNTSFSFGGFAKPGNTTTTNSTFSFANSGYYQVKWHDPDNNN